MYVLLYHSGLWVKFQRNYLQMNIFIGANEDPLEDFKKLSRQFVEHDPSVMWLVYSFVKHDPSVMWLVYSFVEHDPSVMWLVYNFETNNLSTSDSS